MSEKAAAETQSQQVKKETARSEPAGQPELSGELFPEMMLPREKALPRSLPPRQVLALQRKIGNRSFNQLRQPQRKTSVIQRGGEAKAGGGVEVTAQSMKVTLNFTPSKSVKSKYAEVKFSTPVAVEGELKSKDEAPVNVGGEKTNEGSTAKISINVYKDEAVNQGKDKLAQLAYDSIDTSGFEVDKVDWENELGKGEGETGDKVNIATGVKVTYKNGQEEVLKATLFEKEAGVGMSGPKLEFSHQFTLASSTLWENPSAILTAAGKLTLKAELAPNWTQIFTDLAREAAQRGGWQVARAFMQSALRGLAGFLLGPGGFIMGGALTLFALGAEMSAISEIEECKKRARAALHSYACGWCIAWGVENYGTGSSTEFFEEGLKAGRTPLDEQVRKIQTHPVFAPWGFTADELRPAIKAELAKHPGEVYNQVESQMQTKIFTDFVLAFYQKGKASLLTPDYIARKDAIWVARGLGLPDSVVPEEA